jgi:hypothetical protein
VLRLHLDDVLRFTYSKKAENSSNKSREEKGVEHDFALTDWANYRGHK